MGWRLPRSIKSILKPLTAGEKPWNKELRYFLSGTKPKVDPRVRRLERENEKLKEALALQTQELMLLKKEMNLV